MGEACGQWYPVTHWKPQCFVPLSTTAQHSWLFLSADICVWLFKNVSQSHSTLLYLLQAFAAQPSLEQNTGRSLSGAEHSSGVCWWEKHRVSGTITAIAERRNLNVMKMLRLSPLAKAAPLILRNTGSEMMISRCIAKHRVVSVGFIPSGPDNPPSPEAWDMCEAKPERRTTSISSCYLSGKRSLVLCTKHMHNRL